jgi:arginyl-tRNA synthetase
MSDVTSVLAGRLRSAMAAAFGDEHAGRDPLLSLCANRKFGDYQANVAMGLGKQLGQAPRKIAEAIVGKLDASGVCDKVDIAGPGFINLGLARSFLTDQVSAQAADGRLGVAAVEPAQTVVIDYGGPNIAKQMHVGHLRSLIIGDCFVRVLDTLGHRVVRQNHVGDWGLQMGMVTSAVEQEGLKPQDLTLEKLEELYRSISAAQKTDRGLAARLIEQTRMLQSTPKEQLVSWQAARKLTLASVYEIFDRLGVLMEPADERGESAYSDDFAPMMEDLRRDGFAVDTEGAVGVFAPGFTNRDGDPLPFRILSRDGTYQYATFDLAALRHRAGRLGAGRIIYTHDSRQADHFAMLFAVGRQVGYVSQQVRLDFAAFGTVLGPDNKPLKTREGENVKLADLLAEAESRAGQIIDAKSPNLDPGERKAIARAVGIGALKYADLSNDRVKDYVFDWDRMLAFEGNTAPYLQNAYVRIRSIFRKGGVEDGAPEAKGAMVIGDEAERALVLRLLQFPAVVDAVAEHLEPHRLCTYLYELATSFHQFYERCPVLKAVDDATRRSRLRLCDVTARVMEKGMGLLGIEAIERM